MTPGTWVVIGILAVIVVIAVVKSRSHIKGEGGCCGGGKSIIAEHKELEAPQIGEKLVQIEGMHCENCKNSIERAVNRIEGAVCKVNLKKKNARVIYSKEIDDEELKRVIERLDFQVVSITEQ